MTIPALFKQIKIKSHYCNIISILVLTTCLLLGNVVNVVPLKSTTSETPLIARQIEIGEHICIISSTNRLLCAGLNDTGQLGTGNTLNQWLLQSPSGLANQSIISVAAAGNHTCAVTQAGAVKCWGYNTNGRLGNGTANDSLVPTDVVGLTSGVQSVKSEIGTTCALLTNGSVKCWGPNGDSRALLGVGINIFSSTIPIDVVGLSSGVAQLEVGSLVACVRMITGQVKCWGENDRGQIGDNTNTSRPVPTDVQGLPSNVTDIALGTGGCAVLSTGAVMCWGLNHYGQVGNGTIGPTNGVIQPVLVTNLDRPVIAIDKSPTHTCVVLNDGQVKCWGNNEYGQLGDGTKIDRAIPVQVIGLGEPAVDIAVGGTSTCAILQSGAVKCWGDNQYLQSGNGALTALVSLLPIPVVGFGNTPICGNNLLTNPGYESGLTAWNRWDATSSDSAAPHTGSRALKLAGAAGGVGQVVPATAGQSYTANGWGKVTGGAVGRMGIRFYNSSWATLDTVTRDVTGTDYQPYRIEQTAPPGTAFAELWVNHTNDQGEQHADEMCLFASGGGTPATLTATATVVGPTSTPTRTPTATPIGPTPTRTPTITPLPTHPVTVSPTPTPTATPQPSTCSTNQLTNPGFEQSFTGWVRWDANNAIVPDARSGTKAVRLGTAASGIGQGLAATPGQSYSLTAYAKVVSSTAQSVLGLTFFDDQWRGINAQSVASISGGNYAAYTVSGVAPANARYAIAWVSKQAADSGYLFADDFCLTGAAAQGGAVAASLRQNADGTWSSAETVRSFETYLPLLAN